MSVEVAKESQEVAIRLANVNISFGERTRRNQVLKDVSFSIPSGKTTVIAGGSGQGKSVMLKLILGLLQPDSGQIVVLGQDVPKLGFRALRELRMHFGVLFQGGALFDSLTVFENIALPLRERTKLSEGAIREKVLDTLMQLELVGHENKFPAQISGGMQKRVGLARALQLEPQIVLYDEPTTGLDPQTRESVWKAIRTLQQDKGVTIFLTTHYMEEAELLCDRLAIMDNGKIIALDTPKKLVKDLLAKGFKKPQIVEQANLEDVFIDLTGKALRD